MQKEIEESLKKIELLKEEKSKVVQAPDFTLDFDDQRVTLDHVIALLQNGLNSTTVLESKKWYVENIIEKITNLQCETVQQAIAAEEKCMGIQAEIEAEKQKIVKFLTENTDAAEYKYLFKISTQRLPEEVHTVLPEIYKHLGLEVQDSKGWRQGFYVKSINSEADLKDSFVAKYKEIGTLKFPNLKGFLSIELVDVSRADNLLEINKSLLKLS